ncbi:MAG: hypothetical protein GX121_10565 [Ignavibacteria bacterium]|jgi:hypothetical protein|nr:hypothetical protein [Ignavibacteria bacterium]
MKTTIIILSTIICLLLFYTFFNKNEEKEIINYQHDTLFIVKESEPIIIEKAKTKVKYLKDTIIIAAPFQAELDTIIKQDTLRSTFFFPEMLLSFELRKKPDTLQIEKIMITKEIPKKEHWWKEPLIFISGFAACLLLYKIK